MLFERVEVFHQVRFSILRANTLLSWVSPSCTKPLTAMTSCVKPVTEDRFWLCQRLFLDVEQTTTLD